MAQNSLGKVGITFNNVWASGVEYGKCCIVTYNGVSYMSKIKHKSSDGTETTTISGGQTATIDKNDPATDVAKDVTNGIDGVYWLKLSGVSGVEGKSAHANIAESTDASGKKLCYVQTWEGDYATYAEASTHADAKAKQSGNLMGPINEVLEALEDIAR